MKQTPQGDIIWSRSFNGFVVSPQSSAYSYKCFELKDRTLLMVGNLSIPEPVNGSYELAIWHLDANGNVLWQRTDSSTLWQQNAGSFYVADMTQDPAGNIYLAGNLYAFGAVSSHTFVVKIDGAGNIIWDQSFTAGASQCYGLLWTGSQLSVVGTNFDSNNNSYLWNMKLDPNNGSQFSKKAWVGNNQYNMFFSVGGSVRLLDNGNISVTGGAFSDAVQTSDIVHCLAAEFDQDFNFIRGSMLKSNVQSNYYNTRLYQYANGRISYTYMKYISGYDEDIFYGAIEQGQIVKERILHQRSRADAWTSNFLNVGPGQDIVVQEYSNGPGSLGAEFVRLHDSDTSSACIGKDSLASWLEPYTMKPYANPNWYPVYSNTFRPTIHNLPFPVDGTPVQTAACKALASCNSFQLLADQSQVCAGAPVTFTAIRNTGCGGRPLWYFDMTNIESYTMPNDTTLQLTYRDQFKGTVTASMSGTCSNLNDTKQLTVLPAGKPVDLGADTWLCPDSTLVLRPAPDYGNYLWQDGSIADTLKVTAPGTYSVTVSNSCGLPMSASVIIQTAPLGNFSAGPDASACLNIPVTLQSSDGYLDYSWTNIADGSIVNSQTINVTPGASTKYIATAKTTLGCSVKSMLAVTIIQPLQVHLGKDVSFCQGDSILLDAGAGFLKFLWNNGATGETIYASRAGAWSVKALSPNGCYGSDTLQIVQLYPLPVVHLDADKWLCEDSSRILDAGSSYSTYVWQDGSTAPTLQVDAKGTYWVQVTDNNGCIGADTVSITEIVPNPVGFLIPDTVICNGYPSTIAAKRGFSTYNWSDGETTSAITAKQADNLLLTVTDGHGCRGTEAIEITTKQCLFGIRFPNAFTPDGNGVNDIYRPYVLGNVLHYHFQIFNRWGQLVFATDDYAKGWDGRLNGSLQTAGTFVWVCEYQFSGESMKMEKGTLLLIP
jgi:gliding motility-associated-like protein